MARVAKRIAGQLWGGQTLGTALRNHGWNAAQFATLAPHAHAGVWKTRMERAKSQKRETLRQWRTLLT
eukprot:10072188-Lingulodinium_polyedra.AAC.1